MNQPLYASIAAQNIIVFAISLLLPMRQTVIFDLFRSILLDPSFYFVVNNISSCMSMIHFSSFISCNLPNLISIVGDKSYLPEP